MSNRTFSGIINISPQIPVANISDLSANNADIENLTVDDVTVDNLTVTDLTVTGTILAADGTVAAPSYSFTSDTNTGIYHSAADTIGFSAGGTQQATINTTNHLSVHAGGIATPSVNFLGDENTGIFNHGAGSNRIGFSAGGTLEAVISTIDHLSVNAGTVAIPAINFGVTGADINTGMYRIGADQIGLSTGGVRKVGVYDAADAPYIEGLNVGTSLNIAGIQRLSAISANSWEDGHMGNSSSLVFTPADFVSAGPNLAPGVTLEWANVGSTQPDPRNVGRFYSARGANGILIAQKIIPKGFKITVGTDTLEIFTPGVASITGCTCYVSAQSLDIGSGDNILSLTRFIVGVGPGPYTTNTSVTLNGTPGNIATGDGLNIVTIYFDAIVPLTDSNGVGGAQISMTRV